MSGAALLREELNADAANTSTSLFDSLPVIEKDKGVMMANFEEWIKMATDNKINTTNSWNFALIDYFHDLNVLREGDNNINFQKASATLDGCVKIYSSRVDSVATETGRLLSGLATRKREEQSEEDEESGDEEDGHNDDDSLDGDMDVDSGESKGKKGKSKNKSKDSGSTLTTFDQLKVKKLSQELSIDPLFKKTLAEFDEGGAKSLLLNTLGMDKHSRVVFDASTTNANGDKSEDEDVSDEDAEDIEDTEMSGMDEEDVDISSLKHFLFDGDDSDLTGVTLCPSIGHLDTVLKDINKAKSILNEFHVDDIDTSKITLGKDIQQNNNDYDDYYDGGDGGDDFDFGANENSYGELDGEAAAVIFKDENDDNDDVGEDTGIVNTVVDQDLMAYFDDAMKRNWAGPEHWKVRQLKKEKAQELKATQGGANPAPKARKQKEAFVIDFLSVCDQDEDDYMAEQKQLFAKAKTSITLPQAEWESADSNLLPDDMLFSSEHLTKLFLKPSQRMNIFRKKLDPRSRTGSSEPLSGPEDLRQSEATIWAENYKEVEQERSLLLDGANDDNDDNLFYDDGGADYFGDDAPFPETLADGKVDFGTQLIAGGAKVKPEYVTYSKKAKNVNIKKLKDNMWKSVEVKKEDAQERQFSDIVGDIGKMYPSEQKKDLSTSLCFICLLHLANEHGLTIENDTELKDLKVTGFDPKTLTE